MKRKQCEESLRCNVVRGRGLEVYWRLDNVREMLMSGLPGGVAWQAAGARYNMRQWRVPPVRWHGVLVPLPHK